MAQQTKHLYEFGPYRIDPTKRLLLRGEAPVPLPSKAFETLLVLVQHREEVVSKDHLMKMVWPDSFVEESNLSQSIFLLRKALGETAQDRRYIVTIPGRGYRFAEEVREISEGNGGLVVQTRSVQTVTTKDKRQESWHHLAWVALAFLFLAGLVGYRLYTSPKLRQVAPGATASAPYARRSVAVLGFRNLSGRPEEGWLSTAVAEMLGTELAAGEKLRLVSGEDIARAKLDLPLADTDSLSRDTLARLHKNLGSDLVVLGSYTTLEHRRDDHTNREDRSDDRIRLDLRLQDAIAGETIADVAFAGSESDLFDLVAQAGARLREELGVEAASPVELVSVRASLPSNREAARFYSEGLARLRVFDALEARSLLQEAIAADPKYPLSHSALAEAWSWLGYDGKAQSEAVQAYQLATNLSRENRLVVEGRYRETNHEYGKAVDIYRGLLTLFPDNLDYGLRLADVQCRSNKGHEALVTVAALRKLPAPLSQDPRIDLQEADAWDALSDFKHEAEPLARAIDKGKALGAQVIVAEARKQQCWALSYLEQERDAVAACREARDIFASVGDGGNEAATLRNWASAIGQSDPPQALHLGEQALAAFRRVGCEGGVASTLNSMANRYFERGDIATSEKMHRDAQAAFRRVGNKRGLAIATANIAVERAQQGDLSGAMKQFEEALQVSRNAGNMGNAALVGLGIANVYEFRGDLSAAKQGYEASLKTWEDIGDRYDSTYALDSLGNLLKTQDEFSGAHKVYEQSLALKNSAGDKIAIAQSHVSLAALGLEEGQPVSSLEGNVSEAIAVFQHAKLHDDEAWGQAVLARVLFAEDKVADGKEAMHRAQALAVKSQNIQTRWDVAIAVVRAEDFGKGQSSAALLAEKKLAAIVMDARKRGFFGVELDARLALAEVEMKSGQSVAGRAHLATIGADAKARRYNLIARKAAAAGS